MDQKKQSQKEELLIRQKNLKEEALAFQHLFASEDGELVLKVLARVTKCDVVILPIDSNGRTDPWRMAKNEGNREVMVYIRGQLNKTFNQPEQERAEL